MATNKKFPPKSLGDGLFSQGGAVFCLHRCLSREDDGSCVTYEYDTYYIKVYYTAEEKKRTFVRWERVYK